MKRKSRVATITIYSLEERTDLSRVTQLSCRAGVPALLILYPTYFSFHLKSTKAANIWILLLSPWKTLEVLDVWWSLTSSIKTLNYTHMVHKSPNEWNTDTGPAWIGHIKNDGHQDQHGDLQATDEVQLNTWVSSSLSAHSPGRQK